MIVNFDDISFSDMRKKLLEAKEILRYLNDNYLMDSLENKKIYADGSSRLGEAASFVDDLMLLSYDSVEVGEISGDDPEEIVPDPRFSPEDIVSIRYVVDSL